MLAGERQNLILDILREAVTSTATVNELAQRFAVTSETIRRDLKILEDTGLVQKTHGGVLLRSPVFSLQPFRIRTETAVSEKRAIARAAAELVQDGDTVIVDSGSTTGELAKLLRSKRKLTVITNALHIVTELGGLPGIRVLMPGGLLNEDGVALVGPEVERSLRRYQADKAFIGVIGIDPAHGFSASNVFEAEAKQAMMKRADRVIVIADHTKFGVRACVSFAPLTAAAEIITDDGANGVSGEIVEAIRGLGAVVRMTPASKTGSPRPEGYVVQQA